MLSGFMIRGPWVRRVLTFFLFAGGCTVFLLAFFFYGSVDRYVKGSSLVCSATRGQRGEDLTVEIPDAWKELVHDLKETEFTTKDNLTYSLSPDAYQWPKLGKRVLILDVDSRLDLSKGAMLNPGGVMRGSMNARTGGILNHMLYALIHGYDYRLVRPPGYTKRHSTWVKVPVVREALKNHDIVVFLDADAIFEHPNLPLEWLLSHWNITEETLVAMPEDVENDSNHDDKGKIMWNTGVMIAHQSDRTQQMFRRWEACPTEEEFEGCSHWLYNWAHEQAAFAHFIRYEYDMTEDLRVIPCNEANGTPEGGGDCNGTLIGHYWHSKEQVVDELYDQAAPCTIYDLHQYFHDNKDKYFLDASDMAHPLENLVV